MTISNTLTKNVYSGNDVATVFAYEFPISDSADLLVYVDAGAGLGLELMALTTDYTLSGVGDPSGGSVTFLVAPPTITDGRNVLIQRETALTQNTDYIEGDTFPAEAHEEALDKLTRIVQEQAEELDRAVKLAANDDSDPNDIIASITNSEAAAATSAAAALVSQNSASTSAATATTQAGIATTQATNAAASATAALVSENNAETAETNAAASAASIVGDAAAAAASAAAASTSEINAATSETNAAASAAAALTSENNAETSETNAAVSEANAAQSAADAAASAQGVPTGSILDFGGNSAPTGFLLCDGSNVNRTTYAALFTAIGTAFGVGDGSTTFGLPDFRRRVAVGSGGTGTGTLGNAVGNSGGAETHTLSIAEMPSHDHPLTYSTGAYASGDRRATQGNATLGATSSLAIDNTGSGDAHNNMQPSLVVTKIIKT